MLKEQHTGDNIVEYLRWVRGPPWNATSMVGLHHSGDCSCGEIKHALFLHFGWEWTRNGGIWGWVGSAQNSIRRKFIFSQNISDTISLSLKPRARTGNVNWLFGMKPKHEKCISFKSEIFMSTKINSESPFFEEHRKTNKNQYLSILRMQELLTES